MEFLGFIISVIGVTMDPRRVSTIIEWPLPKSFHEIQQFIGFCNFFRRFIYAFSTITKPLTDMLKGMEKGKKSGLFELSAEAEHAFRKLQASFTTAPVLQHFDPGKPIQVYTDASVDGLAGILCQPEEWEEGNYAESIQDA